MTKRFITLVFLFLLCNTAFGEPVAPPSVNEMISVPATLKTDPVQEIRFGHYRAKFEKTTLGEIRNTIGAGKIDHAGEAGGSQYWLCYSMPGQSIWLISNGEMGGSNHTLTQVVAIATGSVSTANDKCPPIPNHLKPVSLPFGWIGADKKDLYKALGQPSKIQGRSFMYLFEGKKPAISDGQSVEFDVTGYIELKIVDGKVTSLYVSHVTSY